jgi:hypothetical protein
MTILYHYTSLDGIEGIRRAGVIRSSDFKKGDAAWGRGVYLTSLPPSTKVQDLMLNNWGIILGPNAGTQPKLNFYISFRSQDLPNVQKTKAVADVWLVPHPIDMGKVPHRVYERQHCSSSNTDRLVNVSKYFNCVLHDRSARYVHLVASYISVNKRSNSNNKNNKHKTSHVLT